MERNMKLYEICLLDKLMNNIINSFRRTHTINFYFAIKSRLSNKFNKKILKLDIDSE